jgi:hypothetical protein
MIRATVAIYLQKPCLTWGTYTGFSGGTRMQSLCTSERWRFANKHLVEIIPTWPLRRSLLVGSTLI